MSFTNVHPFAARDGYPLSAGNPLTKGANVVMKGAKTLVLLGLLSASTQAWAEAHVGEQQRFNLGNVEFTLGAGLLNGEAEEKVYDVDNGAKVSQLDWQLKQVPTLHLGLSWHPMRWLTLDARGWTQIAKGDSHMKDYDWLGENDEGWTDYSDHPDTRVQKA